MTIEPAPGAPDRPLLTSDLRSIKMGALLEKAGRPATETTTPAASVPTRRSEPARKRLDVAARVYLAALSRGEPPTKAVATVFGVKPNTVRMRSVSSGIVSPFWTPASMACLHSLAVVSPTLRAN